LADSLLLWKLSVIATGRRSRCARRLVLEKLSLHGSAELILYAVRKGMIR